MHTSARGVRDTNWSQVIALYDQLVRLDPSPIIFLNGAIAVAELEARRSRWQPLTVSTMSWAATTPITRPARICCAG